MPHYAKFLKEILSKKRKFDEDGVVNVPATCSAVIQKNLPLKMQDLGSFTILCTIGNYEFGRAVCDSKASINLMPLFVVKRLGLGELTSTTMTIQMVERSMAQPEGILEDVLIKVEKFIFLVYFVVMDIEEDRQVPLVLDKPFLATGAALINVRKGELILRVGDEVHLNLNQSLKQPDFEKDGYKNVEKVVPTSSELIDDCKNQDLMNENMMNFRYIEDLDTEYPNASFELKETILSLNEDNAEKSSSSEDKA